MRKVKITFYTIVFVLLAGLFDYVLPQHDIVRITSTEVIRTDFTRFNRLFYAQADSGSSNLTTRDLRLINTEKRKTFLRGFIPRDATGGMVYRNEDTGWIWPPYFKFDSSDLQAIASANIAKGTEDQWVVLTHYGWRNRFLSIYPNAIGILPVAGPDVRIIPWFNIFFFVFLAVGFLFLCAAWRQFRERSIDPALADVEESWDAAGDRLSEKRGRVSRWLGTWQKKR